MLSIISFFCKADQDDVAIHGIVQKVDDDLKLPNLVEEMKEQTRSKLFDLVNWNVGFLQNTEEVLEYSE